MNELTNIVVANDERMTSLQIAEVTGKAHKNVMQAIRKMETAWVKVQGLKFQLLQKEVEVNNGGHKMQPYYSLTKEECLYIATKFNDEARAKLVRRWKELEEARRPAVPQNYLEALKAMVRIEEQKQQLAIENQKQQEQIADISRENVELGNKITEMLPKVSYYDKILEGKSTMTVTQIAQDYGMSAVKMNRILAELKIQRKVQGQWILYNNYVPCGYVHSKAVDIVRADGRRDVKYNTEWTVKGRIFLYNKLKESNIIPLIEQDIKKEPVQQTLNL